MEKDNKIDQNQPIQDNNKPLAVQVPTNQEQPIVGQPVTVVAPTKMALRTREKKELMLKSLVKSQGIVMYAAQLTGIDRRSHERWMNADSDYKEKVKQIEKDRLDSAEAVVMETIARRAENPALALKAAIFALENLGAERGYTHTGVAVQVNTQVNGQTGRIWDLKRILSKEGANASPSPD